MYLSFKLTMPGRNSWNNKWSGQEKNYVIVKNFRKNPPTIGSYSYDFGDGWRAGVEVSEISALEAPRLKKKSDGFCGYDWMVNSIIKDGEIYGPTQPKSVKT